eukprot:c108_g1_i1.p1 GENE.c108_g1_i1~~c108_g1_i1.p1  ORF type:complete len:209 (-),score=14.99 c108_g1_i1:4-558(-)
MSSLELDELNGDERPNAIQSFKHDIERRYQRLLDTCSPHWRRRWTFTLFVFLLYFLRVFIWQGWYIVTYALGIYILNLFIGFLSPRDDPEFSGPSLPTNASDEFRPFQRRLPEFTFWLKTTKAVLFALVLTCSRVFDVPVFWPLLLVYFCMLFCLTMEKQIKHMLKYKYVPFSFGKKHYGQETK